MSPTPSNISAGSLDMTLREMMIHMAEKRLDHVVLVIPNTPTQVTITIASEAKTKAITEQVERIFRP
jgi:hypothetical protein